MKRQKPAAARLAGKDLPAPLLADLHAACDADGVFRAVGQLAPASAKASYVCMALRPLPSEEPNLWCTRRGVGVKGLFSEVFPQLEQQRQRQRAKIALLAELPARTRPAHGKSTPAVALLGFDDCGYDSAALLFYREKGPDFERAELARLELLHLHVSTALRNVRALQRERVTRLALQRLLGRFPIGVLLLDWDGSLLYRNRAAAEYAALWNFGESGRSLSAASVFEVPREVRATCRRLRQRPQPSSEGVVIAAPSAEGLRAVVQAVRFESQPLSRPRFLVHFEATRVTLTQPSSKRQLPLLIALTPRERELVPHVVRGDSNAQLARKLKKSVHTVKKQLQVIFRKLGVKSRAQLIAALLR